MSDIKQIWENATVPAHKAQKIDLKDMHRLRKDTSDRVFKNIKKGFIFDITLKSLILLTMIIYMVVSKFEASTWSKEPSSMFMISFIFVFLLTAMIISAILSIRQFNKIPLDRPVLDSLERKLEYVKTTYRKFMFGSALTAPLFVFTGNIIYYHQKYGEIKYNDPVLFVFLLISFLIAYFAQLPSYNMLKRELEEAVSELDETKVEEFARDRRKQTRLYTIVAVLGLIILILLIVLLKVF